MDTFESTGRKMPYIEDGTYVNRLLNKVVDRTLTKKSKKVVIPLVYRWASVAAIAILLVGVGIGGILPRNEWQEVVSQQTEFGPLDKFLGGLTDEEAKLLAYYECEEIVIIK